MPQPGRVGLFVPLSGVLATAGRAVRDGFIAAYLDDTAPLKPPLRVYDTAAGPIGAVYEQSQADGVDLIVGPLSKHRLEALRATSTRKHGRTWASTTLETASGEGPARESARPGPETPARARRIRLARFSSLGLAIEDEAATIGGTPARPGT